MTYRETSRFANSALPAVGIAHTDVHRALRRYFELAQDFIVASLAIVLLVVMVQSVWVLARLAFVLGRNPAEVLSQIVLVLVLVELFRTLILYLHEHRVAVPLMLEVAIVSELREILLNQPAALSTQVYADAILLAVLGTLLLAYHRFVSRGRAGDDPSPDHRPQERIESAPRDQQPPSEVRPLRYDAAQRSSSFALNGTRGWAGGSVARE